MAYIDKGVPGEAKHELFFDVIDLMVTRVEFAEKMKAGGELAGLYDDALLMIDNHVASILAKATTASATEVTNWLTFAINQVVQARRNVRTALSEIYSSTPIE